MKQVAAAQLSSARNWTYIYLQRLEGHIPTLHNARLLSCIYPQSDKTAFEWMNHKLGLHGILNLLVCIDVPELLFLVTYPANWYTYSITTTTRQVVVMRYVSRSSHDQKLCSYPLLLNTWWFVWAESKVEPNIEDACAYLCICIIFSEPFHFFNI